MNEDRLRDALRTEASGVHVAADASGRLDARLARPPRARSPILVGVAIVVVAVLVAGVVALVRDPERRKPVDPAPAGMPKRILGITEQRQPVVLDVRTGRVLARYESHSVERGTQIAVAPDGRSFYFVDGDGTDCDQHSILGLGLTRGGPVSEFPRTSTAPAVSADGRYVAYLRCRTGDNRLGQIVLRDLVLGTERATDAPDFFYFTAPLIFDADSRHVIVGIGSDNAGLGSNLTRIDLVGGGGAPGEAVGVGRGTVLGPLPVAGMYLSMLPERRIPGTNRLGDVVGGLAWTGVPPTYGVVSFGGWFGLPSPVRSASAAANGRHFVAVSRSSLYRWSRGDDRPVRLRSGIRAAAWIPDPVPRRRAVVAVTTQYQLERIDPRTGARTSLPGGEVKPDAIAVDPGTDRVVAAAGISTCTPQLISVSLTSRAPAVTVLAAQGDAPAIDPGGQYLAYLRPRTDCHGGTAIVRRDLATGAEVEFPAPEGTAYVGLRWLPNGRDVLTRPVTAGPELPAPDGREHVDIVGEPVRRLRIVGDPVLDGPSVEVQDQGYAVLADGSVVAGGCGRGRLCEYGDVNAMSRGRRLSLRASWPARDFNQIAAEGAGRDFLLIPSATPFTALYTWRRGEPRPRRLATGILAAAWFDAPAPGR